MSRAEERLAELAAQYGVGEDGVAGARTLLALWEQDELASTRVFGLSRRAGDTASAFCLSRRGDVASTLGAVSNCFSSGLRRTMRNGPAPQEYRQLPTERRVKRSVKIAPRETAFIDPPFQQNL